MSEEASIVRETGGDGKPCESECETGSPVQEPSLDKGSAGLDFEELFRQDLASNPVSASAALPPLSEVLKGFPAWQGGSSEWHAMDASLRLARNRRVSMPWERQVRARPSVASLFAEPMLGRFDSAVCARPMEQPSEPWRLRALQKIRTILLFYPEDSELGRSLISCAGTFIEESQLTASIEDSFAGDAVEACFRLCAVCHMAGGQQGPAPRCEGTRAVRVLVPSEVHRCQRRVR